MLPTTGATNQPNKVVGCKANLKKHANKFEKTYNCMQTEMGMIAKRKVFGSDTQVRISMYWNFVLVTAQTVKRLFMVYA